MAKALKIWARRQAAGQEAAAGTGQADGPEAADAGTGGHDAWHGHGEVRVEHARREHERREVERREDEKREKR